MPSQVPAGDANAAGPRQRGRKGLSVSLALFLNAMALFASYGAADCMIRLVLFDIDGTLIHTSGAGEKAFARVFANLFGIADGTEKLKFAGRTDAAILREFFL